MSGAAAASPISAAALAHLRAADPVLGALIERVGPFQPSLQPDLWWALVGSIVGQQLSVQAAATIRARVAALANGAGVPGPVELLAVPEETLRACGLSRAKAAYVRDLARRWADGELDAERIRGLPDEAVIAELTRIKGIGRWTAEMVLIFSLGRPDVLPVDDLGFRTAVQRAYGRAERPGAAELRALGEPWRPYRTAATLYLWRSLKS